MYGVDLSFSCTEIVLSHFAVFCNFEKVVKIIVNYPPPPFLRPNLA